jgi:hypothetical protein
MGLRPTVTLRLTIENPVSGVTYSLQDGKSTPVNAVVATDLPLSLDVPVRVGPESKLTGELVRREGPERRFIYIAIGAQAGDEGSPWSRRAKIDVHDIADQHLDEAIQGKVLECRLPGRANDDGPACGTVRPLNKWIVIK